MLSLSRFQGIGLAAALDLEPDEVGDRAGGTVFAGNPLGVEQGHGAGFGRHGHLHVKQAPRRVGGVHPQFYRGLRVKAIKHTRERNATRKNTHYFNSINALPDARV